MIPPPRQLKIVLEGPGEAGKTANLEAIHASLAEHGRPPLIRLATATRRTLFFDLLTFDLPAPDGRLSRLRLMSVPGQVFYDGTRRLVLEGADAIVFVADSSPDRWTANLAAMRRLRANLLASGRELANMPGVLQVNKRDARGALPVEHLDESLNPGDWPTVVAEATAGRGVLETLALAHEQALMAARDETAREVS